MTLAEKLRELTKMYNISGRKLSLMLGKNVQYINCVMHGQSSLTRQVAQKLAEIFPKTTAKTWLRLGYSRVAKKKRHRKELNYLVCPSCKQTAMVKQGTTEICTADNCNYIGDPTYHG